MIAEIKNIFTISLKNFNDNFIFIFCINIKEKYRDINDEKFVDIYNFLKRKGTKIGIHREGLLWDFQQLNLQKLPKHLY